MARLEYVPLGDPAFEDVARQVARSYPDSCILWVQRVRNDELRAAFEARVAEVRALRADTPSVAPVEVRSLFHGTAAGAVDSIARWGFDPALNRRAAYGCGTYFATAAALSKLYAPADAQGVSYMLLCRVLVGALRLGAPGAKLDTALHDNFVDNLARPGVYVTPYADGAVPEYAVAFHAAASGGAPDLPHRLPQRAAGLHPVQPVVRVEGRGARIRTVIDNLVDVADDLGLTPVQLLQRLARAVPTRRTAEALHGPHGPRVERLLAGMCQAKRADSHPSVHVGAA